MTSTQLNSIGVYERGVHVPLALALGDCSGIQVAWVDRFSKEDADGLDSQVDRHTLLYPDDPDVQEYRRLIAAGVFDGSTAADPRVGSLSASDVNHLSRDTKPSVVFAKIGTTLFLRVSLSAAQREIRREDGSQDNVYTVLLLSLLNYLDHLREVRWGVDETRAGRDAVNWALLIRRHSERNVGMTFAGQWHDPTDKADRLKLTLMGAVSSEDDPARRRKFVESTLARMARGEACMAPELVPLGWSLPVNHRGKVEDGALPVADLSLGEALGEFHTLHADGATFREIFLRLVELEKQGKVYRRSGLRHQYSYADALTSPDSPVDIRAIVARMLRPLPPRGFPSLEAPSRDAVDAYVGGGDPVDLFTLPQRWAIARIEMLRTGVWLRVLKSDIAQRGLVLAGQSAISFDPLDEKGFFFVEAPWPFPVDPESGRTVERFGIPDDVLRRSAARILLGFGGGGEGKRGGQAHVRAERRPFVDFGEWRLGEWAFRARSAPGAREGLVNTVVLRRDASITGSWGEQYRFHSKYAVGTFRQQSLASSVADAVTQAVEDRISPSKVPSIEQVDDGGDGQAAAIEAARLTARAVAVDAAAEEEERKARGAREMAALLVEQGEPLRALEYEKDAAAAAQRARESRADGVRLRSAADKASRLTRSHSESNVSVLAYLVAGLRRAAQTGKVPDKVGGIADRLLRNWRLIPSEQEDAFGGKWLDYTVDLVVPVVDPDDDAIVVPLAGRVPNVRTPRAAPVAHPVRPRAAGLWTGPRIDHAGSMYFGEGRSLDEVSVATRIQPHVLVKGDLRKWLSRNGVSNLRLITALIDHPLPEVRQIVFEDLTGASASKDLSGFNAQWRRHVADTYRNQSMKWGPAACPDDLTPVHRVMETLKVHRYVTTEELAGALGLPRYALVEMASPRVRDNNVPRPQFLDWGDHTKASVALIVCPHRSCGGYASRAVLLPEVAASGYGGICVKCRRVPNASDPKWSRIIFPPHYIDRLWSTTGRRPRPVVGRTSEVSPPAPLEVPAFQPRHRYAKRVRRAQR